jgi:predicted Rossmann fold flavoprotein
VIERFDVVIVGAGAAGLMCAMAAGRRGRRVLLLERGGHPGAKILISGGGRCNFTNLHAAPERFISGNPDFCRSALSRYSQHDFIALVESHHIAYHEKALGQLFCDDSARQILTMLLTECAGARVDLRVGHQIGEITHDGAFRVATSRGNFVAPALVLATGGLSVPKLGASGFAYDVARRFGLSVTALLPGLVGLRVAGDTLALVQPLAGVSLDAVVMAGRVRFRESLLFTHRGLSGPAILQISSYWRPGMTLSIDLAPEIDLEGYLLDRKRNRARAELKTVLAELLPVRLAHALAPAVGPLANVADRILAATAQRIKRWQVCPVETEGWGKAEVTVGGIDTRGLSSQTMGARTVPGLYAIGEAVDVTGWLGGYNFQWAWSSGWCAGQMV